MNCNDLLILLLDVMNSYNYNNGKILKQETIKMIIKYKYGIFISENNGKKLFEHYGNHYGYKIHFYCIPEKKYIEIIMINHNPKYFKNLYSEANKVLK